MATTQPGGYYKVGDRFVDASGESAKKQKVATADSSSDELPEDFPGRDELIAGGFTSRSAVKAASDADLIALDGIGEATVKKIRDVK